MLFYADDNDFRSKVLKNKDTVLVDFFADWCSPCQMISPVVEDIAKNHNVCKINVDTSPAIAKMYNVKSIPTLIVIKNGDMTDHIVGYAEKEQILNMLD